MALIGEKNMGERYLYQKCPFLKALSQEKREQFEIYFRTAPDWLIDSLVVEKIKKGQHLSEKTIRQIRFILS